MQKVWRPWDKPISILGTNGWCKVTLAGPNLVFLHCTAKIRVPGKRARFCKNDGTYARWIAETGSWETPLCTVHYRKMQATPEEKA